MTSCYNCFGAGTVTCTTCGGKGSDWHAGRGKPEWSPCPACGGRRTVTCPVCFGRGQIGTDGPPLPPRDNAFLKWWSQLPDRSKKTMLVGLAVLVVLYFLSLSGSC
jgi:hypothetical protein